MRTITAHPEIDKLFASRRRVSHPALLVLASPTPDDRETGGRVMFAAGTRLGPAVFRNRCKRVMRAAVRRCGGPWPGWDLALVARKETATARPGVLDEALTSAIRRLGISE